MKKTIVLCVALAALVFSSSEAWSRPVGWMSKHRLQKNCGIVSGTFTSNSLGHACLMPSGAFVQCSNSERSCWGQPASGNAKSAPNKRQLERELLN